MKKEIVKIHLVPNVHKVDANVLDHLFIINVPAHYIHPKKNKQQKLKKKKISLPNKQTTKKTPAKKFNFFF